MLKPINRYVVSILLAIGLHALLLLAWVPTLQPIQLRLQSGDQAISLQLTSTEQPSSEAADNATRRSADKPQVQPSSKTNPPVKQHLIAQKPIAQKSVEQKIGANKALITAVETLELPTQKSHQQESLTNREPPPEIEKKKPVNDSVAMVTPAIAPASSSAVSLDIVTNPTDTATKPTDTARRSATQPVVLNKPSEVTSDQSSPVAATKPKGVFAVAQPLSANNPKYPRRAIMRNQQGRVKVNLWVDESGYVDNIELIESSGYAMLDNSVFRFAEEERFVPATQDGIPVASTQSYLFRFVLE